MSDSAAESLKRMREAEKKQDTAEKQANPDDFHVRLVILKLRRRQLGLALLIAFCTFVAVIARDYRHTERLWWVTGLPIVALGLIITVIPTTEEWEYRPWQARPRQYERHQIER